MVIASWVGEELLRGGHDNAEIFKDARGMVEEVLAVIGEQIDGVGTDGAGQDRSVLQDDNLVCLEHQVPSRCDAVRQKPDEFGKDWKGLGALLRDGATHLFDDVGREVEAKSGLGSKTGKNEITGEACRGACGGEEDAAVNENPNY